MEAEAGAEAEAEVGGGGEVVLGASLCVPRASTSSRASSPPSAALATLATTESAASALDRSRLWCARNVAASWRSGGSAPSLQRGAEVPRCREVQRYKGEMVQRYKGEMAQRCMGKEECSRGALTSPHSARRTWPTHRGGSRTPAGRERGGMRPPGNRPMRACRAIRGILSCRCGALESVWGLGTSSRLAGTPGHARRVRHVHPAAQAATAARPRRRTP